MAGSIGSLGGVSYDVLAEDKTGAGLDSARKNFVVTAGDIVRAIDSISGKLTEFDEKNTQLNADLGITALTLGMNAEELRGWASELSGPTDSITEMSAVIDELARAGLRGHDVTIAAAEGFDNLADALGVGSDVLTNQMVPALKAMDIPLQNIGIYSDILGYTMNSTGVRVEDFTATVKRIGPELAAADVGMEDLAAVMVILKDRGYEGKNMMSELTMATQGNTDANKDGKISQEEFLDALRIGNVDLNETKTRLRESSVGYADQAAQIRNQNVPIQEQYNTTLDNTLLGLGALTSPLTSAASLIGSFASTISAIAIPAMILFPTQLAALGAGITGFIEGAGAELFAAVGGSMTAAIGAGIVVGLAGVWVLLETGIMDGIADLGNRLRNSGAAPIMSALQVILAPIGSLGAGIIALLRGDLAGIPAAMAAPFQQAATNVIAALNSMRSAAAGVGPSFQSGFSGVVGAVASAFSGVGSAFNAMAGQIRGIFGQLMTAASGLISSAVSGFYALGANLMVSLANGIIAGASAIPGVIGNILGSFGGLLGRAAGGPVGAGESYIVGESGPELFTPSTGGSITPNNALGGMGGGGDTWHVTINAQDRPIDQVLAELERRQTSKRTQKGYRSTA